MAVLRAELMVELMAHQTAEKKVAWRVEQMVGWMVEKKAE